MKRLLCAALALVLSAAAAHAESSLFPDRRRTQYQKDQGYAFFPYLYDLPGIGSGYGFFGAATNVADSYTDLMATLFLGDVDGEAVGVNSLHLIDQRLILDFGGAHLSRATLQTYAKRGMASGKNDYVLAEVGDTSFGGARLTATFMDRRVEGFCGWYGGTSVFEAVRDKDGNLIAEATDSPREYMQTAILGGRLDFTDDYMDPRRGARLEASVWRAPRMASGPDFFYLDTSFTGYLPLGKRSTWAVNLFKSDAYVIDKGETDRAKVAESQGLDCSTLTDPLQKQECESFIDDIIAQNTYGTATALGGYVRLRSYPEGRFKGAHTQFFGNEIRWNLTEESTPFDIFIMKDIRTAVQFAFFYEIGSVADKAGELWDISRKSYGAGLRVVTGSGLIYRVDLATGDEGFAPSIFFQYPWEL